MPNETTPGAPSPRAESIAAINKFRDQRAIEISEKVARALKPLTKVVAPSQLDPITKIMASPQLNSIAKIVASPQLSSMAKLAASQQLDSIQKIAAASSQFDSFAKIAAPLQLDPIAKIMASSHLFSTTAPVHQFLLKWENIQQHTSSLVSPDLMAILALLEHLGRAKEDPVIGKSEQILALITCVADALGDCCISELSPKKVGEAFAKPGRQATNVKNAKKSRLKHKDEAEELCKDWFAHPTLYKNKTAFVQDVLYKEWCKDRSTASKWLTEFIKTHNPSAEWRAAILKKAE